MRLRGALLVLWLAACPAQAAAPPRPPSRGIVIANWAPRSIQEIYVSAATSQDWGVNRLDGQTVTSADEASSALLLMAETLNSESISVDGYIFVAGALV